MASSIILSKQEIHSLASHTLLKLGLSSAHAEVIANLLTKCQMDDCGSHGLYRLLMCADTIKAGKVSLDATPEITDVAASVVRANANKGFSILAFEKALPMLVDKAKSNGVATLAINHCFHFSALWPEVEKIAEQGLVAMAMLPSHSWVAPSGGVKPVFGTNPIAFAWPRPNQAPYVFDLATSASSRGDMELYNRQNKAMPSGWAIDKQGNSTTDASEGLAGAMLPFGGHKGSAISTMIELMAGPLIGDLMSTESMAFDNGDKAAPYHGEIIIAFDPKIFLGASEQEHILRAENLFDAIVGQGARLPSVNRYKAREKNEAAGQASVPRYIYDAITSIL